MVTHTVVCLEGSLDLLGGAGAKIPTILRILANLVMFSRIERSSERQG